MDSYIPMGGFQTPFQRRLSRLYNDTKKSSDFVKEPPQSADDPEIKALHRKLRIQKDRLVSWGLEWSESSEAPEIDESLSKAGLVDLVGSIMATIKDILAEAEPLWAASKRGPGPTPSSEKATGDRKVPLIVWDKGRFEDLVRDLTASIDTLCDLSRTRSEAASSKTGSAKLAKSAPSLEDLRPYGPSRLQAPRVVHPSDLITMSSIRADQTGTGPSQQRAQEIAIMNRKTYSELTHRPARQPWAPVLVEYAPFDSIYSTTGIMPSMSRFERLSAGLQIESQRSPSSWVGLPQLLGYYEDMEQSRLVLVYQFPTGFDPVVFESLTQNPIDNLCTLTELLNRPDFEPRLEAKFRLAHNLATTVFDMHVRGITHGNLRDSSISFCNLGAQSGISSGEVDVRRPLISSFDLFPDSFTPDPSTAPANTLHRHPLDPRTTPQSPLASNSDSKTLDLYSLAMLLVSIGLWTNLENLVPNLNSPSIPESVLEQLAIRCGTPYMKAVQACWNAVEHELVEPNSENEVLSQTQSRTCRFLEACCILDGVSGLDDRLNEDSSRRTPSPGLQRGPSVASSSKTKEKPVERTTDVKAPAPWGRDEKRPILWGEDKKDPSLFQPPITYEMTDVKQPIIEVPPPKSQTPKMRLYPQVALSDEVIEQWNNMLMPQINMALKSFYRKNPESVEISLESIGESPQKTTPTVLVVCTSVKKVRAILQKKLGILFDGTTGFGLKVCRGSVLRSRKRPTKRSMAKSQKSDSHSVADSDRDDGDSEYGTALNPDFQDRPRNGASIGAWIGDKHLPPVSFGGLIMVDDKPYGMTVHHMLDDPDSTMYSNTQGAEQTVESKFAMMPALRSSAASQGMAYLEEEEASSFVDSGSEDFACEFSDSESELSATDITSDYEDDDEDDDDLEFNEPGDIPGVEPGCGEGYVVTQPALDDMAEGFYPEEDTMDEDHLDTCSLGEIYASSGIRRRNESGLVHEIDWALFEFSGDRQPDDNSMPRARQSESTIKTTPASINVQPTTVVPVKSLPGLEVQCVARTSGLQTGQIQPALSSVKIFGRTSPSHTYQVSGRASAVGGKGLDVAGNSSMALSKTGSTSRRSTGPLGIPGDSGAWVIERQNGRVCGHVLAWSERKQVAYICPMDILLQDIAETLQAGEIKLPGGDALVGIFSGRTKNEPSKGGYQNLEDDEYDEYAENAGGPYSNAHDLQTPIATTTTGYSDYEEEEDDMPPKLRMVTSTSKYQHPAHRIPLQPDATGGIGSDPASARRKQQQQHSTAEQQKYEATIHDLATEMEKVHIPSPEFGFEGHYATYKT